MPRLLAWRGVTYERHTMFGASLVFDSEDEDGTAVRLLNVNGTFQSVCYVDDDLWCELVCLYHRRFADAVGRLDGPRRAIVLGGGGYSFPKWLLAHVPGLKVDVVEIDPAIVRIAREHFLLDRLEERYGEGGEGRLATICDDGWKVLRAAEEPYDVIVNDAFAGKRPMGSLSAREGARLVAEHLSDDGVYLANVIAPLEGRGARTLNEVVEALKAELGHVQVFPERPEEPRKRGNNAVIASRRELGL